MSTRKHWVCCERLSESFLLMTQAVEGKSIPGFFDEAVYPADSKATCLSKVSTYDSRPLVSDAWGRWRLSLFRFFCTPNKMLWLSLPPLGPFFRIEVQTPTVTLARPLFVTRVWLETHIKPHQFFGSFLPVLVIGCVMSRSCNKCYSICLVASWWWA